MGAAENKASTDTPSAIPLPCPPAVGSEIEAMARLVSCNVRGNTSRFRHVTHPLRQVNATAAQSATKRSLNRFIDRRGIIPYECHPSEDAADNRHWAERRACGRGRCPGRASDINADCAAARCRSDDAANAAAFASAAYEPRVRLRKRKAHQHADRRPSGPACAMPARHRIGNRDEAGTKWHVQGGSQRRAEVEISIGAPRYCAPYRARATAMLVLAPPPSAAIRTTERGIEHSLRQRRWSRGALGGADFPGSRRSRGRRVALGGGTRSQSGTSL